MMPLEFIIFSLSTKHLRLLPGDISKNNKIFSFCGIFPIELRYFVLAWGSVLRHWVWFELNSTVTHFLSKATTPNSDTLWALGGQPHSNYHTTLSHMVWRYHRTNANVHCRGMSKLKKDLWRPSGKRKSFEDNFIPLHLLLFHSCFSKT